MNTNLLFFILCESIFRELMSQKAKSYAPLRHIALNPGNRKNERFAVNKQSCGRRIVVNPA